MKNTFNTVALGALALAASFAMPSTTDAQEAILAEIYGRGVHAYYAGQHQQAHTLFSSAINGGLQDPRAYYFRGIVSTMLGRGYEAESDWRQGASIEATKSSNPNIGRSLSRFQGNGRLKLEQIRQQARLQALTTAVQRSDTRTNTLRAAAPAALQPAAPARAAIAPAPAPPADDSPFGESTNMATGDAKIVADDALADTSGDPFKDDAAAPGAPAGGGSGDPFGGGADAGGGADPFGGGADAGGDMGADPFGGGSDTGADPFGGGADAGGADPFGGGATMEDDPFGN